MLHNKVTEPSLSNVKSALEPLPNVPRFLAVVRSVRAFVPEHVVQYRVAVVEFDLRAFQDRKHIRDERHLLLIHRGGVLRSRKVSRCFLNVDQHIFGVADSARCNLTLDRTGRLLSIVLRFSD